MSCDTIATTSSWRSICCSSEYSRSGRVPASARAAHRQRIDTQSGLADSDRHRLAFLAAGPHPAVQLQVIADHADPLQHIGTVADQGRTLDGRSELAV